VRLFPGIFSALAAQALLAAVVPGGLLVWLTYEGQQTQMAARDRERLQGFAATAAEAARAGRPLDQLIPELDARDAHLAGRVQIATPQGARIAGPGGDTRAERSRCSSRAISSRGAGPGRSSNSTG
jgi:two-component system, OmpR family, sensor histidine kinase BaeS